MPPSAAALPATVLFASEIEQAKRLGFQLQINAHDTAVAARAQPTTPRARACCFAASGKANQAIESTAHVDDPKDVADAMRDVIQSVLNRASEVMA